MEMYRNSYFNFALDFEEGWRTFCWRNRKKALSQPDLHQCTDDDLPECDGSFKSIFIAISLVKQSPEIISSQFSMEVHLEYEGINLEEKLSPEQAELSRKFKKMLVLGKEAQALETSYVFKNYILYHKVIAWEVSPSIWLSACMRGDTVSNYENALRQFGTIKCTT